MDTLFDVAAADRHPDATIARQEIRRYYADQVQVARAALAEAHQRLADADRALATWATDGRITDGTENSTPIPGTCCTCYLIISATQSRWMAAAGTAIDKPHQAELRDAANAARDREQALLRWLVATGHDVGPFTPDPEPAPRRRSR